MEKQARRRGTRQVALAVRAGVPYLQESIEAILIYARERGDWQVTMGLEYWPTFSTKHLRGWDGDGILAWANTRSEAEVLAKLGIPAVNLSAALRDSPVPRVSLDDYAVGRVAAEHLGERGFRRFAHYATTGRWYAQQREAGFVDTVHEGGGSCELFHAGSKLTDYRAIRQHEEALREWLLSLQPPVGLFATHDYRARKLIDICHRIGLRVPEDVAVVGVNNDRTVCEYTDPPLSSVARNGSQVGQTAAELLDRLMSGMAPDAADILVPPEGVIPRATTDVIAIDDPVLAGAVQFIERRLHEGINVGDVVRHTEVSRRSLERAFRAIFGTTPHAYLRQLRVRRAKLLLSQGGKTRMDEIARACGFADARTLRKVFLRQTGISPRRFRTRATSRGVPLVTSPILPIASRTAVPD